MTPKYEHGILIRLNPTIDLYYITSRNYKQFSSNYDCRVVIYARSSFIRLAIGRRQFSAICKEKAKLNCPLGTQALKPAHCVGKMYPSLGNHAFWCSTLDCRIEGLVIVTKCKQEAKILTYSSNEGVKMPKYKMADFVQLHFSCRSKINI